jgi:hypothetical protein
MSGATQVKTDPDLKADMATFQASKTDLDDIYI